MASFVNGVRHLPALFGKNSVFTKSAIKYSAASYCSSSTSDVDELDKIISRRNEDMPSSKITNPYEEEKQKCILCKYDIDVDYKNAKLLSQFISPFTGRIYHKSITGLCEHQYRKVELAVEISRSCGFMPHMHKDLAFLQDPPLFDAFKSKQRR